MIRFAREALGLPGSTSIELQALEARGSDRDFFRLKWNHQDSAILIHYNKERVENTYYADLAVFLRSIDVSAPGLIRHDPAACLMVMEDLGDIDLWSLRDAPWETRRTLYRKTLSLVGKLHSCPLKDLRRTRVKLMEGFGPGLYRWERDYFREHFISVSGFCGIELEASFRQDLEEELAALAGRLSVTGTALIHRDLQSRNIMVQNGVPCLIDFQGMRRGNLFYDLGSLLCDPYVHFSESEREELLFFYYDLVKRDMEWAAFKNHFWEASVQRLMQALGAYGFLGLKKGLSTFLEHIPAGLSNLHLAAGHTSSLSKLKELILACQQRLEEGKDNP